MRALTLIAAAAAAPLTACGGGGGGPTETPAAAPVLAVVVASAGPADVTPIPPAAPLCVPKVVAVHQYADSTGAQAYQEGALQRALDQRYGAGAVIFSSTAVGGTTLGTMLRGRDGRNKPWPGEVDADIKIVGGFGLNEIAPWNPQVSAADFRAEWEAVATTPQSAVLVFQTPPAQVTWAKASLLPQVIRDVAAEHGIALIDADAYTRTLKQWQTHLPDGVHPDPWLIDQTAVGAQLPVLAKLIDPMRCHA